MQNHKKLISQIGVILWIALCSIALIGCDIATDKKNDKSEDRAWFNMENEVKTKDNETKDYVKEENKSKEANSEKPSVLNKEETRDKAIEEKAAEEKTSDIKAEKEDKARNPKDGTYTDGNITVEIISYDGIYEAHIVDGFHDKFYGLELVDNQLVIERVINTSMMPEAENPYDEETHITLSWTEVTEGAFTYPVLNYHRDSIIIFQNLDYPDNTLETSQASMLKKKTKTQ